MRDARPRPDVLRFLNGDSSEISLGENLESVAAFTFRRKPANAPFQFAKACQPVEKPALKIAPRLWMGRKQHRILITRIEGTVSVCEYCSCLMFRHQCFTDERIPTINLPCARVSLPVTRFPVLDVMYFPLAVHPLVPCPPRRREVSGLGHLQVEPYARSFQRRR